MTISNELKAAIHGAIERMWANSEFDMDGNPLSEKDRLNEEAIDALHAALASGVALPQTKQEKNHG